MILALLTSVVLSQNACVPPWRALGTSLEEVRVEGERVVVCANNGGAYPAPETLEHACLSWDRKGIAEAAKPGPARPARAFVEVFPDGGVATCTTPTTCATLAISKAVPPTTLWDVNEDGTRAVLVLEDEKRLAIFDTGSGARLQTLDPTTKQTPCVLGARFIGPLLEAQAMECEGAKEKSWLFSGTTRLDAPKWNADPLFAIPLDGRAWLVLTYHPSTLWKIDVGSAKGTKVAALPGLDACHLDGCKAGRAPLFGVLPNGVITSDVPPLALTGDGGVVVVSSSGYAIVDLAKGSSKIVDFPKCR